MESGTRGHASSTSHPAGAPTKAVEAAASTVHDLVDKLGAPLESAASKVRESAHGAVDKAARAAKPAARWIEQKERYAEKQLEGTSQYVAANPIKALAIAFVAGVIFGRLTS